MSRRPGWAPVACAVAGALVGCLLGGCGFLGGVSTTAQRPGPPVARGATTSSPTTSDADPGAAAVARANRTHELPTPTTASGSAPRVAGGWRSGEQAVAAFAATYVNWTAADIAARLRGLASVSVGQARSAMLAEASEVARDRELHAGGIANAGTVEAVAPVRGSPDRYAVVTRERTSASRSSAYAGLRPAWHVALATVARTAAGLWVVSAWQPES